MYSYNAIACLLRLSNFIVISVSIYLNDTKLKLPKNTIVRYRRVKERNTQSETKDLPINAQIKNIGQGQWCRDFGRHNKPRIFVTSIRTYNVK